MELKGAALPRRRERPYSAVSAGPCRRWPGAAAVWSHRVASSRENTPPHRDTTSSGSDSCGCSCSSWPSRIGGAVRSYPQLHNTTTDESHTKSLEHRTETLQASYKLQLLWLLFLLLLLSSSLRNMLQPVNVSLRF